MAYRRTANLPGTQRYGLTRRQQRSVEEFDFNPNLSRAVRKPSATTPPTLPPSPAVRGSGVSASGGPSSIGIPGLESEVEPGGREPAGPPADPIAHPMTANEIEAMNMTISKLGPELSESGIKGTILGLMQGRSTESAIKGALNSILGPMMGPIKATKFVIKFSEAYNQNLANLESLEASEAARATIPTISQAEVASVDPEAISGRTPGPDPFSEPISQAEMMSIDPQAMAPTIDEAAYSEPISQAEMMGHAPSGAGPDSAPGLTGLGPDAPEGAPTGPGVGDDGDGGDPTVLCTALYNLRDLDEEIYMADVEYAHKYVDALTYAGYAVWARHLAKSDRIVLLLSPLINSFANEMHSRLHGGKGSFVGKIIMDWGGPVCKLIGKIMEIGNGRNNSQRTPC